jgi:hypothetical protein
MLNIVCRASRDVDTEMYYSTKQPEKETRDFLNTLQTGDADLRF